MFLHVYIYNFILLYIHIFYSGCHVEASDLNTLPVAGATMCLALRTEWRGLRP
jgi:hypothetical protein